MKIIVSAGGTMGHINPALAIIEEFKKHEKDLEVLYIGTHNRMEKDIIPQKGIRYEAIEIYGFTKDIKRDIQNVGCIRRAIKRCEEIMKEFKPDVVIGVGGYVTYPVLKVAHKLHIKTFIHEQNSIPGKSNKMIGKYADLIGVSFESSKKYFRTKGRILYTGHPCGASALSVPKKEKTELGLTKGKKLLTVVAGSLGSGSLNDKMKEFLMEPHDYEICYITGKGYYDGFMKDFKAPNNVKVFPFMEELPGLLKISDLAISRAGAGSLSELMALEVPSIIIPSPNVANNHQYYNAKDLSDRNCIVLMEEKDITTQLLNEKIEFLLHDATTRMKLKSAMHALDTRDSALIIYQAIKDMIA